MKISIIIPVYNAEKYLKEAVNSALIQPEVSEIILVEDNSPDNSYKICKKLEKQHKKVKLYTHANRENRGAGETRNLGIQKSTNEYVAFLDADDFFLKNRFAKAVHILENDSSVDGVYEAVGFYFETNELAELHQKNNREDLTTVKERVSPDELFFNLSPVGNKGHFHLNGLTVKKILLEKIGMFDDLRLHQDTVLSIKLASMGKLVSGEISKPVSMRRIHPENRITAKRTEKESYSHRIKMWLTVYKWARTNLDKEKRRILLYKIIKCSLSHHLKSSKQIKLRDIIKSCWRLLFLFLSNPFLLLDLHLVRIKDIKQRLKKP
jgi:glycosyltransferase involved in cell wall biosynthesis